MNGRILVVDDEQEIADMVGYALRQQGYEVTVCYDGQTAQTAIDTILFDLALLDVMLPGVNGFALCRHIREKFHYPVIMLTARVEDADKIQGLSIGADDYITKPFNPLEVTARVHAQMRRYMQYNAPPAPATLLELNGLMIDKANHTCTLFGHEVVLTPKEFSILWYLCEHAGRVVSSKELFEEVWEEAYLEDHNTVMVHIRRIREKLKEPSGKPRIIKTVWGVGYKVDEH